MADTGTTSRTAALVLAGAFVKGAFEAGALEVIASRGVTISRVVAASSGALSGVAYAAGVRARREGEAARELVRVWEEEASLWGALHPSLRAIVGRRGISDQENLLGMLRRHVRPCTRSDPAPIDFHVTLATLRGRQGHIDGEPATTFSEVLGFPGASFDTQEGLERVFLAATASAALPVLFAPVDVPGVGPCSDGGLVNYTPIVTAFGPDPAEQLGAILVVTPTPALLATPSPEIRGGRLLAYELDMIFAEWLYQDLRRATRLNEGLLRLDALAARRGWAAEEVAELKAALDLDRVRAVPIVSIRPREALPGTIFSGLTDPDVRRAYVQMGRERAAQVLDGMGWG
jgi:predicted acylesterase/phospholipase RssA